MEGVFTNYGTKPQEKIGRLTVDQAEQYIREGHFPGGSMLPKVRAAVEFVKNGGRRACIGSVESIVETLQGSAGTQFVG